MPEQLPGGTKSAQRASRMIGRERCRAAGLRAGRRRALPIRWRNRLAILIPVIIGTKEAVDDEEVGRNHCNRGNENKNVGKHKVT